MKKFKVFACIGLLFICSAIRAQEKNKVLSYTNTPLEVVFEQVATHTKKNIYFAPEWVSGILISGKYSLSNPEEILELLLKNTSLNVFTLHSNTFIITKNTLIYSQVINDFYRDTFTQAAPKISVGNSKRISINFNKNETPRGYLFN